MRKDRPELQPGEDLRDLPTYTIPEAALFLGISPRTVSYWYSPGNDILSPSRRKNGASLLSFRDVAEAYVLAVLTKFYQIPLRSIHQVIANAKRETNLPRPLIQADLKVVFASVILEKPARGRSPREMVDLAKNRNLVFPSIVDQLGKRILRDISNTPSRIYPWRLAEQDQESRPVSIDPEVFSGRLVVAGTRIPVTMLLGKKRAGRSVSEIAQSYGLDVDTVEKALRHIERPILPKAA